MSWSYSRINTFFTCPKQYYFRYIKKIKTYTDGIEAFTGSLVHDILKEFYEKDMEKNTVLDLYSETWDKRFFPNRIKIVRNFPPSYYKEMGADCLKNYLDYKDKDIPLFLEKNIKRNLNGQNFTCRIDRISVDQDRSKIIIVDYKTGKTIKNDFQLPLYEILFREEYGNFPIELQIIGLRNFQIKSRHLKSYEYNNYVAKIFDKVKTIEEAEIYKKNKCPLCSWCSYRQVCQGEEEDD